jgi:hypothetical protein
VQFPVIGKDTTHEMHDVPTFEPKVLPNRTEARNKKINLTRSSGQGHARVSHAKKTPASFYTLVAVHQRMPDGTVKKVVIPRDKLIREGA